MSKSYRSAFSLTSSIRPRNLVMSLFCCILLMSFSTEAQAQSSAKEAKRELRKQQKVKKRAAAEKRRTAALYGDADFYDEDLTIKIASDEAHAQSTEAVEKTIIAEPKLAIEEESALTVDLRMERYAYTLKGIPYRYGGMDNKGFDCSGFTCHVFSESGLSIPRTAQAQYEGAGIIPLRKARKGDLLFFGKSKRKISHVGIVISEEGESLRMIHSASSGGIMVTELDSSDYWKSRLHSAGRYLDKTYLRAER